MYLKLETNGMGAGSIGIFEEEGFGRDKCKIIIVRYNHMNQSNNADIEYLIEMF